ncbi:trichohyalin [Melia azedarach]|uniref:Trichohyalin n=1 Tax=Melia azedarach TaxID=155640 RepID=A0ACC1Y3R4_MELAZ|nr:trichohyalin [Melia azedarach]
MAADYTFSEDDMVVDEGLGFPKAYAKICRDPAGVGLYNSGPPFCFTPFGLQEDETLRAKELEKMFPVIDPRAKPTAKPKIFLSLLWKQLNHLGNAGFDPAVIRVDPYGNVLYYHADSASPLAWDIDHWFSCSRGGLTVPSNLRILQWQVCKRKHNKPEFLVPWWDLQLGISVNQFLSIFASSNSDFRRRAFSYLFLEGENEEINASQTVESHSFPQHFVESKKQLGLAPAGIVVSRKESHDLSLALKSLDYNRQIRSNSPAVAARRVKPSNLKENESPDFVTNPYQAIVAARDSSKQREETQKMQTEIQKLDEEVSDLRRKNDEEKLAIQDLELELIKRRRRAEKCRRLAEAQSSYRIMLEKMIRDAMHQSVIYKEQVRLNHAASNALMARLEAHKAICDSAEKELHKKFKLRDDIEKQIRPEWEQARKRSRMDDTLLEESDSRTVLYLPGIKPRTPIHKELRVFLEEEHKASEAGLSSNEERKCEEVKEDLPKHMKRFSTENLDYDKSIIAVDEHPIEDKFKRLEIEEEKTHNWQFPALREPEIEEDVDEDEETRKQRGKGNVERWLQMLLENSQEELDPQDTNQKKTSRSDNIIKQLDEKYPQKEKEERIKLVPEEKQQNVPENKVGKWEEEITEVEPAKTPTKKSNAVEGISIVEGVGSRMSFERKEKTEKLVKEKPLARSESARAFRRIPSSPSLILKKGVDCIRKKPIVMGDDDNSGEFHAAGNNFIQSSIKTIKKAVKI